MLYCNDELVRLNDENWKHLEPKFAKIRKMRGPIRIKTTQIIETNENGRKEKVPNHAWPLMATVVSDAGESQTWMYSKNIPRLKDGEPVFTERSIMIENGNLFVDPIKQTDLVYFLTELSGMLKSGLWAIEDLDKESTRAIEKIGESATIEFFLCSKYSPIYNDHKRLKQLAASWSIANSDAIHMDTLRKQLLDKVYASQNNYSVTKRGIEEFVAEVNGEDVFSEYRTLVQLAIDKKVIGWNNKDKGWYFMDVNTTSFIEPIVFVPSVNFSQKDSILFDYIRLNATLFETIKNAVGDEQEKTGYDHIGWHAKRKLAKDRGISILHKTEEQITQELLQQDLLKEAVS